MNRLERWLLFISDNNPEELEEVAMLNPMIKSALEAEIVFSASEQNCYIYDLKEKARMDFLSAVGSAKEDGMVEERARFIRAMFRKGMTAEEISDLSNLSIEEIEKYKK